MKVNLYAIWDKVADEFGPIFEAKSDAVAWRSYHDAITGKVKDEHEYALYKVGCYDKENRKQAIALLDLSESVEIFPTNFEDSDKK